MKRSSPITNNILAYQQRELNKMLILPVRMALMSMNPGTTEEQVLLAHSLLHVINRDRRTNFSKYGSRDMTDIPVQVLSRRMTGYSCKGYDERKSLQTYMGKVTRDSIFPLKELGLINFYQHYIGQCRVYDATTLQEAINDQVEKLSEDEEKLMKVLEPYNRPVSFDDREANGDGLRVAPLHTDFSPKKNKDLLNCTIEAVKVLRKSKFVYDKKAVPIKAIFKERPDFIQSTLFTLDDIPVWEPKPQYPQQWLLQYTGRLHTVSGPMFIPKWVRHACIKPTDPNNILLELDLKCAQLLILCEILGDEEVSREVNSFIRSGSVWPHIGTERIPKRVKKAIVYSFCFGANKSNIPYLVNSESPEYKVSKDEVNVCLNGLLAPLVEKRDAWLQQHDLREGIYRNALNLRFDFAAKSKELAKEGTIPKLKMASKYLAFLAQGREQLIMHRFISEICQSMNIVTFQYDGLTLEIPSDKTDYFSNHAQTWLDDNFPGMFWDFETIKNEN